MKRLREQARAIKDAADARSAEERHADHVRTRRAHTGVTGDGAGRLEVEGPAEQVAEIDAAIAAHRERLFRRGSTDGSLDGTHGNLTFDAVLAMARASVRDGETDKPIAKKILVRVDRSARLRGHAVAGETVDLPGWGPVPVSVAEALMVDQTWHAVLTAGVAVLAVTHGKRAANSAQRTALDWTEPLCCVRGCSNAAYCEIDHVEDWATTRRTSHGALQRLCKHHHDLKTRYGYRYEPLPDGRKRAVPPEEGRRRRPPPGGRRLAGAPPATVGPPSSRADPPPIAGAEPPLVPT